MCGRSNTSQAGQNIASDLHARVLVMIFCCRLIFLKTNLFEKNISLIPAECPTGWIQIRHDLLSFLIWVQNICRSNQQLTLVSKEFSKRNTSMYCPSVIIVYNINMGIFIFLFLISSSAIAAKLPKLLGSFKVSNPAFVTLREPRSKRIGRKVLLDFSLTVRAATLIFISGCGLAISSPKEVKSGFIYNLVEN